ncbi:Uncharacterised protein [Burkholderia pseudomallei]|nr:hypothetical protein [Burkholderia pseudomallei]CAJ3485380.1 Uncharacterised protein [Burkholderia pseudomallei]CAJ4174440.1 Uncharacterised protein [Burkholderia pseudomallei]CAJ4616618.1 Uncharacterised protein [Burkholderia pseudomallei]CAJ5599009.1 Uncharacterised protein [Burkholderia pseudomallei]CAJ6081033.1 Uncharacterised protein [Burkholderia pseudomallei]
METTKTGLEAMCQRPPQAWGWPYRVSADGENHYVVDDFGDFARVDKPGRVVLMLRQERRMATFYQHSDWLDGPTNGGAQ